MNVNSVGSVLKRLGIFVGIYKHTAKERNLLRARSRTRVLVTNSFLTNLNAQAQEKNHVNTQSRALMAVHMVVVLLHLHHLWPWRSISQTTLKHISVGFARMCVPVGALCVNIITII